MEKKSNPKKVDIIARIKPCDNTIEEWRLLRSYVFLSNMNSSFYTQSQASIQTIEEGDQIC